MLYQYICCHDASPVPFLWLKILNCHVEQDNVVSFGWNSHLKHKQYILLHLHIAITNLIDFFLSNGSTRISWNWDNVWVGSSSNFIQTITIELKVLLSQQYTSFIMDQDIFLPFSRFRALNCWYLYIIWLWESTWRLQENKSRFKCKWIIWKVFPCVSPCKCRGAFYLLYNDIRRRPITHARMVSAGATLDAHFAKMVLVCFEGRCGVVLANLKHCQRRLAPKTQYWRRIGCARRCSSLATCSSRCIRPVVAHDNCEFHWHARKVQRSQELALSDARSKRNAQCQTSPRIEGRALSPVWALDLFGRCGSPLHFDAANRRAEARHLSSQRRTSLCLPRPLVNSATDFMLTNTRHVSIFSW